MLLNPGNLFPHKLPLAGTVLRLNGVRFPGPGLRQAESASRAWKAEGAFGDHRAVDLAGAGIDRGAMGVAV